MDVPNYLKGDHYLLSFPCGGRANFPELSIPPFERILCAMLNKGVSLPCTIEQEDFTGEACRILYPYLERMRREKPKDGFWAFYTWFEADGLTFEQYHLRIVYTKYKPEGEKLAAWTVRRDALRRRLTENAYPSEELRLSALDELAQIEDEIEAIHQAHVRLEQERKRLMEEPFFQQKLRRKEWGSDYSRHPLLPILKSMVQKQRKGSRRGDFWSYAELMEECRKELVYAPAPHARGLLTLLDEGFRNYLRDEEQLMLLVNQRRCSSRGIRLYPIPGLYPVD